MIKSLVTFLITGIISLNCLAQTVPLKKDDKAPFDGVLFSTDKANEVRKELLEKDNLKDQNDSLNRTIEYFKKKDDISKNQVDQLLEANRKLSDHIKQDNNDYKPVLWFFIGVAASTATVYAIKKASN